MVPGVGEGEAVVLQELALHLGVAEGETVGLGHVVLVDVVQNLLRGVLQELFPLQHVLDQVQQPLGVLPCPLHLRLVLPQGGEVNGEVVEVVNVADLFQTHEL